ncbi:hypothetical protein ACFO5R_20750 [Halosolutus amylolyticus]|uniref:Uncharacterized protein n=1 Tax=Halosolutus amylolyticus TaxID=2932267 RepID=A0ABD5PV25_9EURY|nr:hypothetical protein [Halosolutus amylolyticus]
MNRSEKHQTAIVGLAIAVAAVLHEPLVPLALVFGPLLELRPTRSGATAGRNPAAGRRLVSSA